MVSVSDAVDFSLSEVTPKMLDARMQWMDEATKAIVSFTPST
jgi:hypothetical protein